jgi:FkbM family methyltransferase
VTLQTQLHKRLRSYTQWGFAPPRVQLERRLQLLGSDYGGYFLDTSLLRPDAVVYSLGVGEDISFDLALMQRFAVDIHAFDPTPKVKKWLAPQTLPAEFHFHETGIADFDGDAAFYLPPREEWVSHSIVSAKQYSREAIRVPMMRLGTAMRRLGHAGIDILKMDIEGAEYAVIEDIVRERIPVQQLLVEFHHRLPSLGTEKTRRSLSLLQGYGMRIGYVCPRVEIFTLMKTTGLAGNPGVESTK